MLLLGTHDHTIDAKQRLAIPKEFREDIPGGWLIATLTEGYTLTLYKQADFEKLVEDLSRAKRTPAEVKLFKTMMYANGARLQLDPQGRVRLPETLLEKAGLDKVSEVAVIGLNDRMEVRERKSWHMQIGQLEAQNPHLLTDIASFIEPPEHRPRVQDADN